VVLTREGVDNFSRRILPRQCVEGMVYSDGKMLPPPSWKTKIEGHRTIYWSGGSSSNDGP
jgi:hypothetical protein